MISVRDVVGLFCDRLGLNLHSHVYDALQRPGQDERYAVSGEAMLRDLGWQATRSLTNVREIDQLLEHYGSGQNLPLLAEYVSVPRRAK